MQCGKNAVTCAACPTNYVCSANVCISTPKGGCGCSEVPAASAMLMLAAGAFFLRRRRA
jgi:uncharacterized protein (TIGR03382 family)